MIAIIQELKADIEKSITALEAEVQKIAQVLEQKKADLLANRGAHQALQISLAKNEAAEKAKADAAAAASLPQAADPVLAPVLPIGG